LPDSTVVGLQHEEQHHPELLHHFADAQQQRDASSLGMWIFLATEIMFFRRLVLRLPNLSPLVFWGLRCRQ